MKVEGQHPVAIIDLYHGKAATVVDRHRAEAKGPRPDVIEISPQARELSALKRSIDEIPQVRMEQVALMKQQMARGIYRVDAELIAAKMIESYSRS